MAQFDESDEEKADKYYEYWCKSPKGGKQAYLDGLTEGRKEICEKILDEIRSHEGIEQLTKFYIAEIIKNIGVEI